MTQGKTQEENTRITTKDRETQQKMKAAESDEGNKKSVKTEENDGNHTVGKTVGNAVGNAQR